METFVSKQVKNVFKQSQSTQVLENILAWRKSKEVKVKVRVKVASAVHCSLIKHAKISQSQFLLELFKQFDWLGKTLKSHSASLHPGV